MRNLRREGTPSRVFYFEHGIADEVQCAFADWYGHWTHINLDSPDCRYDRAAAFHRFLGHEFFRVFPPNARLEAPKIQAGLVNVATGVVSGWKDLAVLKWPKPNEADLPVLDYYEAHLPESIRVFHVVDIWEVVRDTMGFETTCLMTYDDPDL